MQHKPKVFLDMDGVLDDFVGGACKAHKRESPYSLESGKGCFDMEKLWGITPAQFWKPLDSYEFWFDLEKTPEADQIVDLLSQEFGEENIALLTSPSMFDGCIRAKRNWVKKYYPAFSNRMLFGSAKEFLAGPNRLLVDDRDRNCDDFILAGGSAILVPRAWNRMHAVSDRVIEAITSGIELGRKYGF